jgi:gamma-glutamyltranspeptidase/glutathione hydrolase
MPCRLIIAIITVLFLGDNGKVDKRAARFSHRSAGVPGTGAGLTRALASFGSMPLAQVMAPAIRLARDGITVTRGLFGCRCSCRAVREARNPLFTNGPMNGARHETKRD